MPKNLEQEKNKKDSEIHHYNNNINYNINNNIFESNFQNSNMPEYLKYKIETCGSNFNLINPEIGVIINEKTK